MTGSVNPTDLAVGHHHHHDEHISSWLEIFMRSLAIVGVAELFDKTWFMGLLLAIRYDAKTVFVGSFTALFLHTILAAALGYAFARFLDPKWLNYATAAIFFGFAILYAKDCYMADPEADVIEAGKEEAGETVEWPGKEEVAELNDVNEDGDEETQGRAAATSRTSPRSDDTTGWKSMETLSVLGKSFMGVFIAEWGDRTQIAMIGQHASQPLIPVFSGSVVAFFLLTLSAVGAATLLTGQKLRERVVYGFSAVCFAIFGVLALKDALTAK